MYFYRGPCTVTEVIDGGYVVTLDGATPQRTYKRSHQNVAPWYPATAAGDDSDDPEDDAMDIDAPADEGPREPSADTLPPSTASIRVGDFLAIKDSATADLWWLHRVEEVTADYIKTHVYGGNSSRLENMKFRPLYVDGRDNRLQTAPPRRGNTNVTPWSMTVASGWIPRLVVAHNLRYSLQSSKLNAASCRVLQQIGMVSPAQLG